MGQESECTLRLGTRALAGKAYLESDHVLFRGPERLKVLFKDLHKIEAGNGVLRLEFAGGPAELELGAAAEKWAHKILNPPSRLHKLGVKTGLSVRMVGTFDADFLEELSACRVEKATRRADLIFLAADRTTSLERIRKLAASLTPDGGLWVLYPKGQDAIREIDVISAGRAAGLKDVKVASFSITHTGLKFVIPKEARKLR